MANLLEHLKTDIDRIADTINPDTTNSMLSNLDRIANKLNTESTNPMASNLDKIAEAIENGEGGGGGSIPMCDVTIVNAGANAYDLDISAFGGMLYLNPDNTLDSSKTFTINANESLAIKFALIKSKLDTFILDADPTVYINIVGMGYLLDLEFDTEDYSNVYSDLNNINIIVNELTDGELPIRYSYCPTVIDITKPSSFTFSVDFS